ncbi:MAG: beta-ketoacyl synthase N-terminal-like domain-containing protein, partial [Myxococcota bacterium]|nr:beta-ketoacyl synthase N-terminal-like domain-containing protein [Myxococcota bacterium]
MEDVVVVAAARTPLGSFHGALSSVHAAKLGAIAIRAAVERAGIDPEIIDQAFMGCVLPAGLGQAPARQAVRFAGLPEHVCATTVNKVCGSGLRTVMLAAQEIMCGNADVVIAGGMENMSQAPYALAKARTGYRMGNGALEDLMVKDGLWDPYGDQHMGKYAEKCAAEYGISRERQDDFAAESYKRALRATAEGAFKDEIVPVEVPQRKGDPIVVDVDEEPQRFNEGKMRKLRPAFVKDGTV